MAPLFFRNRAGGGVPAPTPELDWDAWVAALAPTHYWSLGENPVDATVVGSFEDTGDGATTYDGEFNEGNGDQAAEGPFGPAGRKAVAFNHNVLEELNLADNTAEIPFMTPGGLGSMVCLGSLALDTINGLWAIRGVRGVAAEIRLFVNSSGSIDTFIRTNSAHILVLNSAVGAFPLDGAYHMLVFTSNADVSRYRSHWIDGVACGVRQDSVAGAGNAGSWYGAISGVGSYLGVGRTRYGAIPGSTVTAANLGVSRYSSLLIEDADEYDSVQIMEGYRAFAGTVAANDTFRQLISAHQLNIETWWQCFDAAVNSGIAVVGEIQHSLRQFDTEPTYLSAAAFTANDHGRPGCLTFNGSTQTLYDDVDASSRYNNVATGTMIILFKADAIGVINGCMFSLCNTGGSVRGTMVISATDGYLRTEMNPIDTGTEQYRSELQIAVDDGNWHLAIARQPGDGGGVQWDLDGVHYEATDIEVVETLNTGATVDLWLGDVAMTASVGNTPTRVGLGCLASTGRLWHYDGDIQDVVIIDEVLTDTQVDNIWAAANGNLA